MLKGVDKGADGKDKPFIFLKRNYNKRKPLLNQSEVKKKKLEYCINVFVCFVEEVILADDENEKDYDGIYAHQYDLLLYIPNVCISGFCCTVAKLFLLRLRLTQESHKEPQE